MLNMNDFANYLVNTIEIDTAEPMEIFVMNFVTDRPELAKKVIVDELLNYQEEKVFSSVLEECFRCHAKEVLEIVNSMLEEGSIKPLRYFDWEFITSLAIENVLLDFLEKYNNEIDLKLEDKTY